MVSRRHDTTPSDDERAQAREHLQEWEDMGGSRWERSSTMNAIALVRLSSTVEALHEAVDEDQAREIARARAIVQGLRERWSAP